MRRLYRLTISLFVLSICIVFSTIHVTAATNTSISSSYITITVNSIGSYIIQAQQPLWKLGGTINATPSAIATNSGNDNIGSYQEIDFNYQDGNGISRSGGIRNYVSKPVVLFIDTYNATATNSAAFPQLTIYPLGLNHLTFQYAFSQPTFTKYDSGSPWIFFDNAANTFILSPASHFMQASITKLNKPITSGIDLTITTFPAGFTQKTFLVIGQGISNTTQLWGHAMTDLQGKVRPANDADVTLKTLGYWTDHGATYYYNYSPSLGYAGTLQAVKNSFSRQNIPLGYMQLDDWWYPKGSTNIWSNRNAGIYTYNADPTLFPNGLLSFQQQLGIPLMTHAKWVDVSSPYHSQYSMSNNIVTDSSYWSKTASYLQTNGVATYEQDWLNSNALPLMNLIDPDAFMNNMASAMATQNLTMQYSMPLPSHFMQSAMYNNLTSIRVSGDRFNPNRWNNFFYTSQLASSLGIWPWSDVFMSSESANLVLANLSGGLVGVGDPIDAESSTNLFKVIRSDGVVVKPDSPAVPLDSMYIQDATGGATNPLIVSTNTDFGNGMKGVYVFAYARGTNSAISFTPNMLGISGNTYVYNYFTGNGAVIQAGQSFSDLTTSTGSYYIIVPIGQSGIGFIGDQGKFVSLGKKRVKSVTDTGILQATVQFATNEQPVTIFGYAPSTPVFSASDGSVSNMNFNSATNMFTAVISPGADNLAIVNLNHN